MSSVNKVILLGNLGSDPEVKMTPSGTQVCTISIATSDSWTKDGKREERTEWHRVVLWSRLAELAGRFLKKGRKVYVEGRIQTRSWEDQAGQKRYATEVVATNLVFVDSVGAKGEFSEASLSQDAGPQYGTGGGAVSSNDQSRSQDLIAEDVPF